MNRAEEWPSFGEESLDAMIRLALRYGEENQLRQLARMAEAPLTPGQRAELAALSPRVLRNFDRYRSQRRRAARRARAGRIAARALQTAACVLLPLAVAAPVAMANVEPVRQYVMRMMVKTYDDCSEIRLVGRNSDPPNASIADIPMNCVPEGWKGKFYFTYVPDGFELESVSELFNSVVYVNSDNRYIEFNEIEPDESNFIDTEDAAVTYVDVNGYEAMLVVKETKTGTRTIVSWPMGDVIISITASLPMDETLQIARSVGRVTR